MRKFARDLSNWLMIFVLVGLIWVGAEYVFEGAVHESLVDTFVSLVLTDLLYQYLFKD